MTPTRRLPLVLDLLLRLVAVSPREHGRAEHVVVDLVARRASVRCDGSEDALADELGEHWLELSVNGSGVSCEVRLRVGDLRSGRSYELIEDRGREVALRRR